MGPETVEAWRLSMDHKPGTAARSPLCPDPAASAPGRQARSLPSPRPQAKAGGKGEASRPSQHRRQMAPETAATWHPLMGHRPGKAEVSPLFRAQRAERDSEGEGRRESRPAIRAGRAGPAAGEKRRTGFPRDLPLPARTARGPASDAGSCPESHCFRPSAQPGTDGPRRPGPSPSPAPLRF